MCVCKRHASLFSLKLCHGTWPRWMQAVGSTLCDHHSGVSHTEWWKSHSSLNDALRVFLTPAAMWHNGAEGESCSYCCVARNSKTRWIINLQPFIIQAFFAQFWAWNSYVCACCAAFHAGHTRRNQSRLFLGGLMWENNLWSKCGPVVLNSYKGPWSKGLETFN